jgi:hypothetical protein
MAMAAKVATQLVPPNVSPETASDEEKREINKIAKEFLDAFEANYRRKIEERKKK